jgi:hypothetical protein
MGGSSACGGEPRAGDDQALYFRRALVGAQGPDLAVAALGHAGDPNAEAADELDRSRLARVTCVTRR